MDIKQAVNYVASKFVYKKDPKIFDYWSVMQEQNDQMKGDCDDFALTCLWKVCDRNLIKFFINVFVLHKYRIYFCKTQTGELHAVGYAQGLYFDNWTRQALPKQEFLEKTNHKIYFFFVSPMMVFPMILGLLLTYFRKKD